MTIENTELDKRIKALADLNDCLDKYGDLLAENEALREQVKDLTAANEVLESRVFELEHDQRGTPAPFGREEYKDYYNQLVHEASGDL